MHTTANLNFIKIADDTFQFWKQRNGFRLHENNPFKAGQSKLGNSVMYNS